MMATETSDRGRCCSSTACPWRSGRTSPCPTRWRRHGVVTNAVHGFTSMLVYLIREQRPSAVCVAFDAPGATFRDEMLEDYKAGRAETPWLFPPQFDMIRDVMAALAIPVVEAPGFEADDVIATLATEASDRATPRSSSSRETATAFSSCATPTSGCSTTNVASATTRSTTRPASRALRRRRPSTSCWPRSAGTPRTTCPGSRGRREDRGQAPDQVRRPRRDLRPPRREDPQAAGEPVGHECWPGPTPGSFRWSATSRSTSTRASSLGGWDRARRTRRSNDTR